MISITVQAASVGELHANLRALLNDQNLEGPTKTSLGAPLINYAPTVCSTPTPTNEVVNESSEQFAEEKQETPAAGKRKRRTKAEIEAEKAAVTRSPEEASDNEQQEPRNIDAPAAVSGKVSKENVHQALQQVNVAVGLPKAREILASFKVNRISEIKEDQYKAFVDKCNEAVMLEG